ncbi:MAG: aldehyde dehydrogenase family protein [Deltaproteobacteria bacterium]|nr:aldehyde dehydrogenase family protein [Deltaproteobacteria bacterium]
MANQIPIRENPAGRDYGPTVSGQAWIGGEWRSEGSLGTLERRNPANLMDIVAVAPRCGRAEVDEACARARAALPGWSATPAPRRGAIVGRLAALLRHHKERLARIVTREVGKSRREALGSVQEAIDTAEFFQSEGRRLYGQTVPSELPGKELYTVRRPIGVVGAITAGNFPIAVPSWKLVPALLCGNTAVWKPSDDAPGIATLFARLWEEAGLPHGVLNLVHGAGAGGAGEELVLAVERGQIDKISFTGSTKVGRWIGEISGRALQVPSLELGGKNPLVVMADADPDLAVQGAVWASFGTAGQRCTSAGNIILDRPIAAAFRARFVAETRKLRIGDPTREPDVSYGPMMNERFLEGWLRQRETGLAEGARLLLDGGRVPPQEGLFVAPRIFDGVRIDMRIAQEECFGPTVNLIEVGGLDEALAVANGTPYGLSSAIYTRDPQAALRFRSEIRAGMTSINNSTTGAEAHLPFGGNGWSGNGTRESGIWVLDSYTRWQAVNVDLSDRLQLAQIDQAAVEGTPHDWSAL